MSGGRGYFLLPTLSELYLLLYRDKPLHTLPADRQAESYEDSYFYRLRMKKRQILYLSYFDHIRFYIFFLVRFLPSLPSFSQFSVFLFLSVFLCCFPQLFLAIAWAMRCCRHCVADPGAESLLPSNCKSVHFMVHILRSPFVRVPLASTLIFFLTLSHTNNNKSNAH